MKKIWSLFLCCAALTLAAANPYEWKGKVTAWNDTDRLLFADWERSSLPVPQQAQSGIYLRRLYLALTGKLPNPAEVVAFQNNKDPQKYAKTVDKLLASPASADYFAMKWADMLRIKSEFPINLWPNAVQAYHRWIRESLAKNRPADQIVRDLLTASGSNFRNPPANFFRAVPDRTPTGIAASTALTWLGMRQEDFAPDQFQKFSVLFSRIRYKSTNEWKEEIVYTDPNPHLLEGVMPDGTPFSVVAPGNEPRVVFADWLLDPKNPYFAKLMVNRLWQMLFGIGLVEPADHLASKDAVNPELLDHLAKMFIKEKYNIRKTLRRMALSAAFRASPVGTEKQARHFASYPVHRLDAEVVIDILSKLTDTYTSYVSVIPEPFTYLPPKTPAVQIADGSITSSDLDIFGRPSRDTGVISERRNQVTPAQILYLSNSGNLFNSLRKFGGNLARTIPPQKRYDHLYLRLYSRYPTQEEYKILRNASGIKNNKPGGLSYWEVTWLLINSKEFLFQH